MAPWRGKKNADRRTAALFGSRLLASLVAWLVLALAQEAPRGVGDGFLWSFAVTATGHVIAGGAFTISGGAQGLRLTRFDGSFWVPLSASAAHVIHPNTTYLYALSFSGGMYIGGDRATLGDTLEEELHEPVARWDGASWTELHEGARGSIRFSWAASGAELHIGGVLVSANQTLLRFTTSWGGLSARSSELILMGGSEDAARVTTLRWEHDRGWS